MIKTKIGEFVGKGYKDVIREGAKLNPEWYISTKLAEEASELATAALQDVNKPSDTIRQDMVKEAGDTLIRIELMMEKLRTSGYGDYYDRLLKRHIIRKMDKMDSHLKSKKYEKV